MTDSPGYLARALLLRQTRVRLPVNVWLLSFDKSVVIDSFGHYCTITSNTREGLTDGNTAALRDGCTLVKFWKGRRVYIILYNEHSGSHARRRFTLAHEIGHIYLGHSNDSPDEEREANTFAAELLMPRILVEWYLQSRGRVGNAVAELSCVFGVSRGMAELNLHKLCANTSHTAQEMELLRRYKAAVPLPGDYDVVF